ncbi:IclR family transcriptional regulator [Janibacter sp. YIM B02568]|uniref:IclR family transcriptional regulator n=1 Tax=Janibacter endophyticus TaxID=2806261 RepID=UPI00194FBB3A|nr:IclR family transcriptional regulator [Janibacter endophyticus]MBM6545372.1 IclR family transcriptional regulator [Janibacter endophyticus]
MTATVEGRDTTQDSGDRAAVDKAISLLASFGADAVSGVGVSELARRADLSKSTAFRVLGMLERNRVVERVGRKYRLGARLQELSRPVDADEHLWLREFLIPACADLYEKTHEIVHVSVLEGTDVIALHRLFGGKAGHSPSRIGERLPAHAAAAGKVMLAHDPQALEQVLSAPLEARTSRTITDPDELMTELARIREGGLGVNIEEAAPGMVSIAAPVRGSNGRPRAALAIVGTVGRIDLHQHAPWLRKVAAGASQALIRAERARYRPVS